MDRDLAATRDGRLGVLDPTLRQCSEPGRHRGRHRLHLPTRRTGGSPFINWLIGGKLPPDQTEVRHLAQRAKSYRIINGELYRRGHSGVLQRYILDGEGRSLLEDIHDDMCGHHVTPQSIVGAAFRQGLYWPTAVADAELIVHACEGCQFYAQQTHLPARALQTIPIT